MKKTVRCLKCGSLIEYEDKAVHEGLREMEDVQCPNCGNVVAHVFTDLIPFTRIIEDGTEEE